MGVMVGKVRGGLRAVPHPGCQPGTGAVTRLGADHEPASSGPRVPTRNWCGNQTWADQELASSGSIPDGVSEVVGDIFLPNNEAKHKNRRVLNCCSQATLGVSLDENALRWMESINQSSLEAERVLLRNLKGCEGLAH